ncbi:MAG: YesL family protein [Waltera sp.]
MKIFDLDSPLMNVLNKMADLMWLNILTLICCIPVITAGAALTSMHYVALKIVRNEESYITRSFFKSFKTNFRQATLIWLLLMLVAAILGGDYYIITKSGMQFSQVLVVLIMAAGVLVICTSLYVFPVLAKFDNTIMGTIRNAFIMSILQLPKTVVMFVMAFFPLIIYLVSLRLIPIIFLFGFSLPAYASAMLYNKFFQKVWKISCCQNRSLHRKSRRKRMREYSMMNWMKA